MPSPLAPLEVRLLALIASAAWLLFALMTLGYYRVRDEMERVWRIPFPKDERVEISALMVLSALFALFLCAMAIGG